MSRWLLIPLALAAAAGAWFALRGDGGARLPIAIGAPPLDEIDDASRRRLERVLEDADPVEPGRGGAP